MVSASQGRKLSLRELPFLQNHQYTTLSQDRESWYTVGLGENPPSQLETDFPQVANSGLCLGLCITLLPDAEKSEAL